jgi:hypothetical protein
MMGGMLFTLTNLKFTSKITDAIDQNVNYMQHIQSQYVIIPKVNTAKDSLCLATKVLISKLTIDLTNTASKIENRKLSLTEALYNYSENTNVVTTTFFPNEYSISPTLIKLKKNLQAINQLLKQSNQPSLFHETKTLKDPNWERTNFDHLPLYIVVERLQLLNIELSQRISK